MWSFSEQVLMEGAGDEETEELRFRQIPVVS